VSAIQIIAALFYLIVV